MANCTKCQRELSPGGSFCPHCGALGQLGAVSAMIEDARRALASDPDDAAARYNLAIAYKLGGVDDLALEELQRVAELQPDFADVYYEMGVIQAKLGKARDAVSSLNRALELEPAHARAKRLLGRLQRTA